MSIEKQIKSYINRQKKYGITKPGAIKLAAVKYKKTKQEIINILNGE